MLISKLTQKQPPRFHTRPLADTSKELVRKLSWVFPESFDEVVKIWTMQNCTNLKKCQTQVKTIFKKLVFLDVFQCYICYQIDLETKDLIAFLIIELLLDNVSSIDINGGGVYIVYVSGFIQLTSYGEPYIYSDIYIWNQINWVCSFMAAPQR